MVSRSYTGTALERARVFDGRGFQLHYEDVGHGDTVVFLAGYLMDLHLYDAQVEGLKDRYRCMRLDRRGHGGSDLPPGPWTMDDLIEDAIALITSVAADPCHLVGMSLGGAEITPTAATSTPPQEKAAAPSVHVRLPAGPANPVVTGTSSTVCAGRSRLRSQAVDRYGD